MTIFVPGHGDGVGWCWMAFIFLVLQEHSHAGQFWRRKNAESLDLRIIIINQVSIFAESPHAVPELGRPSVLASSTHFASGPCLAVPYTTQYSLHATISSFHGDRERCQKHRKVIVADRLREICCPGPSSSCSIFLSGSASGRKCVTTVEQ